MKHCFAGIPVIEYKFYITFYSHFITDLELQLGTALPPRNNTSIATWSGLLACCRDLINIVRLQV